MLLVSVYLQTPSLDEKGDKLFRILNSECREISRENLFICFYFDCFLEMAFNLYIFLFLFEVFPFFGQVTFRSRTSTTPKSPSEGTSGFFCSSRILLKLCKSGFLSNKAVASCRPWLQCFSGFLCPVKWPVFFLSSDCFCLSRWSSCMWFF